MGETNDSFPKNETALKKPLRGLVLLWIAWAVLVIGFQALAVKRLQLQVPDRVLEWTAEETSPGAHAHQPYLLEPFMNQQVAYDSEFYISIAIAGYDDPTLRAIWLDPAVEAKPIWDRWPLPLGIPKDFENGHPPNVPDEYAAYSLNYAFLPFYPLMIRAFSYPLNLLGLDPVAAATLGGVIVSLLGTLGAMLALYDLTRDKMGPAGVLPAFYLVAFPTGFFLAMVHTEGLFVGLAFGALAMLNRKRWLWAALLAGCATVTRAVGGALIVPLGIAWLGEALPYFRGLLSRRRNKSASTGPIRWDLGWKGLLVFSPLAAFGVWNALLGAPFRAVEAAYFNRGMLAVGRSVEVWVGTFRSLFGYSKQGTADWIGRGIVALAVLLVVQVLLRQWLKQYPRVLALAVNLGLFAFGGALACLWLVMAENRLRTTYYMFEFGATILALVACVYMLRSRPGIALFGLLVVVISFFSAVPQGMPRYILGVPAVFMMLGQVGHENDTFDRAWTIGSVLLMGLFALLFAFNFWVA